MSAFHFQAQTVEKAKEACQLSFKEGSQKLPQDTFIYISLARIHSQDFIQFPGSLGGAVFSLYSHEYCWKSETPCPGKKREVGQPTIFAKLLSPQSSASASSQTLLPLESPRLTAMHISPSSSHVTLDQGLTFWPLLFVVVFFFTLSWVYRGISYTRLFQVHRSVSSDTLPSHEVTTMVVVEYGTLPSPQAVPLTALIASPSSHLPGNTELIFVPMVLLFPERHVSGINQYVAFCVWLLSLSKCFWESSVLLWV